MESKLVSKSPVLRFKLGRKIVKMQFGKNFKRVGTASNGLSGIYFNPDDNKLYKGGLTGYTFLGDNYSYYSGLGGGVINASDYIIPKKNNSNSQIINGGEIPEISVVSQKPKNGRPSQIGERTTIKKVSSPIFYGTRAGGNINRNALSNITDDLKSRLIGTGKFTELDFANTKSLQTALNNYFANDAGAGSIKVDNLWGNQTLKAFNLALSRAISPVVTTTKGIEILKPVSVVPTYTLPTTPINLEVANLKLNVPTYVNADRSQTRDWMRTNDINPYSVSGATRAAIRRIRAGQADDNDRLLVKGNEQLYNLLKGYYKQGGQLPSRNPIKRFKQK